ncbi:kinase-like domain-containing protein [Radiomyces spectabilis]|uniref:kinase-like domain-containing protein n=1 Tax=Radiomyces spectabilis TaxID=64574 RepID=UPI00222088B0|nr:kinase-like domain-containing protein [Radiomyces spectabilis]KAI8379455.1 kinase-like domain-containing protein [Radiomyces spectabilis]
MESDVTGKNKLMVKSIPAKESSYAKRAVSERQPDIEMIDDPTLLLPINQPLSSILQWLEARINHEGRVAMLRECYRYKEETSFEELRLKYAQFRKRYKKPNYIHRQITTVDWNARPSYEVPKQKARTSHPVLFTTFQATPPIASQQPVPECEKPATPEPLQAPPLPKHDLAAPTEDVVEIPIKNYRQWEKVTECLHHHSSYHDVSSQTTTEHQHLSRYASPTIVLSRVAFKVEAKLGEGGMAKVYRVRQHQKQEAVAMKIEAPPNPWEYYILHQLFHRLPDAQAIIRPRSFLHYGNVSFLLLDYLPQGTLLDCLNVQRHVHQQSGMPEPLAMLFIMEFLNIMLGIHRAGIIHCDLKLDNLMLHFPTTPTTDIAEWRSIRVIDFGRAIDLTLFNENTTFLATWPAEPNDLREIIEKKPWLPWSIDYWGVAGMAHLLLFGLPLSVKKNRRQSTWEIQQTIKRYWHKTLWTRFFSMMLNPGTMGDLPITDAIESLVTDMKDTLTAESKQANNKLSLLMKQLQETMIT